MSQETFSDPAVETSTPVVGRPPRGDGHRVRQSRINRREKRLLFRFTDSGWIAIDAMVAVLAVFLAFMLGPYALLFEGNARHVTFYGCAINYAVILTTVAHIAGLHDPRAPRQLIDIIGRACLVVGLAVMILNFELVAVFFVHLGRYISAYTCLFSTVGIVASRLIVWRLSSNYAQRVCFAGDDAFCYHAVNFLDGRSLPFDASSMIDFQEERSTDESQRTFCSWAVAREIDEVVYDPHTRGMREQDLLECLDEGIRVSSYPDFVERNFSLVPIESINADWLFSSCPEVAHPYYNGLKRLVDVIVSTVGMVVSFPILVLAVIAIKLESKGAAFYSQDRIGRFNRTFRIYKLRTMVNDAEREGAKWASEGDSRITRIGKFLRKTRIDEIPQFWNVIRGDMSLVGPRPERPEFVEMLADQIPFYLQRHMVKPGLTGWAQINYPYGASVEDAANKLKYDLYYVKHSSPMLDFQIALRTLGTIMSGSR
jgi:exopolysaccharide biosynthesis polyprenyl glycosylphosphotransferase